MSSRGFTYSSHKTDDDAWGDDAGEDHIAKGIGEGNSRHDGAVLLVSIRICGGRYGLCLL